MGCALSTQGAKTSVVGTKVVFPNGEIQRFYEPVKAAELMLQVPNFFLVSTASLHTGKRISALKADEDLEMSQVYVFLPMKRLNSAVTSADMVALFSTTNADAGGMASIGESCLAKLDMEEIELRYRLCRCRSRKPPLETIAEETVNLRFMLMIEN